MKELHMSWSEIKRTPRVELMGLVAAMNQYSKLHSFDGYSSDQVSDMAKNDPNVRRGYNDYLETKANYELRSGAEAKRRAQRPSFKAILKGSAK